MIARNFKPEAWVCFGKHLQWTSERSEINLLQWKMYVFIWWQEREKEILLNVCLTEQIKHLLFSFQKEISQTKG